jgi:hypothetical protein
MNGECDPAETVVGGNGLDPDAGADDVPDSTRCGFCGRALDGKTSEQIGDKRYHSEACAAEARKSAPPSEPPKKRSRIKRPSAD